MRSLLDIEEGDIIHNNTEQGTITKKIVIETKVKL